MFIGGTMRDVTRGIFLLLILAVAPAWAATNSWSPTGTMGTGRNGQTATLLASGKVLVAGGSPTSAFGGGVTSAELYDPATGVWSPTGSMNLARNVHTATLLPSGKVLVAGGAAMNNGAELYDPVTGQWVPTGSLLQARALATATLLPSGKVLIAGGLGIVGNKVIALDTAELYDPSTGQFTLTGAMNSHRLEHAATLLASGKILVSGGRESFSGNLYSSAELYDPALGTWQPTGSMNGARALHPSTLLGNGKVLVVGSLNESGTTGSAEVYDPSSGQWTSTPPLSGSHGIGNAALLPSGKVLVAGGIFTNSCDVFDPNSGLWTSTGSLNASRYLSTMTLLPSGQILVAGGINNGPPALATSELFDPTDGQWSAPLGAMHAARQNHTATPLPSGKVLVAGGSTSASATSAELFDTTTQQWTATGSMTVARAGHMATLLATGKVVVTGGTAASAIAELYDPATGMFAATGAMGFTRRAHTATLLASGKVLVSGGQTVVPGNGFSAEIYEPSTGLWVATGSMHNARSRHTATQLSSGLVLVVAGVDGFGAGPLATAELYNPATGLWTTTGSLGSVRESHTATLLPSGKVLVAGGVDSGGNAIVSSDLYDPATGLWTPVGALNQPRFSHSATLLASGRVLVAGGGISNGFVTTPLSSAEIYDPLTRSWFSTDALDARVNHTATLMRNGIVLVAGGVGDTAGTTLFSGVMYDEGLAPTSGVALTSKRQPTLSSVPAVILQGASLAATSSGSSNDPFGAVNTTGFRPNLEASGGQSSNSTGNSPVFQVQRVDNGQMRFLSNDQTRNITDTAFWSSADSLIGFTPGPVVVRVWVNGVPSQTLPSVVRSDRIFSNGFEAP